MKKLFLFLSIGLIAGFIFFAGCGGDGDGQELTPQQEQAKTLQGTWVVQSATVPQGVDPTILSGGTLTFNTDQDYNPTSFNSSGVPDFFSAGGSAAWTFSGQSTTQVVLSNVSPVTEFSINNLSGNSLSISFSHPGLAGPRTAQVTDLSGAYTASLSK